MSYQCLSKESLVSCIRVTSGICLSYQCLNKESLVSRVKVASGKREEDANYELGIVNGKL